MKIQEILKQSEGKSLEFKKEIPKNRQNLLKIKAAQRYDHTCHPTIGGVLLFCSSLPDEYSYASFRVSRFKAENRAELINSTNINDGLLATPEKIMDFIDREAGRV